MAGAPSLLAQGRPIANQAALTSLPQVSPSIAAMPRLRDAASPAARLINAALAAEDHRLRLAVEQCKAEARGRGTEWTGWDGREVDVAMAGPDFLSVVANDSTYCAGPHPAHGTVAFTFDLRTGRPVDWAKLLPAPLVEGTTTEKAMDGTTMGLVRSKLLAKLATNPSQGCDPDEDAAFQLWPDVSGGGVYAAWADPPFSAEECGDPTLLDLPTLRRYGASPILVQALDRATSAARRGEARPGR